MSLRALTLGLERSLGGLKNSVVRSVDRRLGRPILQKQLRVRETRAGFFHESADLVIVL